MTFKWTPVHVLAPIENPLRKFDKGGQRSQRSSIGTGTASIFPTRSPSEIANALLRSQMVSLLEMNVILSAENEWKVWDRSLSNKVAQAIGHILQTEHGLYNDCVWRALYARFNPKYFFPTPLVQVVFQIAHRDRSLLKALYYEEYDVLVDSALKENKTPHQLLKQYNLPLRSDIFLRTAEHAIDYYLRQKLAWQLRQEMWLIHCLQALSIEQRHQSVNHLLSKMTKDALTQLPNLQQQLYQWYPQRSQDFGRLSTHSQQLLQLFDFLRGWNVFELYTEKVFGYRVRDVQSLFGQKFPKNDKRVQARHALSRMGIWSNYTSHMEQVTFFVPHQFKSTLFQYQEFRNIDAKIFQYADIAAPCLIFHIAHVTMVQYLWSPHQSTVTAYGHAIAYRKMNRLPTPSEVYRLQELHAVKCFQTGWQNNLYRFIRDTLRLQPNEGWTEFRGYPKRHIDSRTGLPK